MNWVQKYVDDVLCDLKNSTVENNKLFLNGVTVKSAGSDMEILIYQLPSSDVIAEVVYENRVELYSNQKAYSKEYNDWIVLSSEEKATV
ncbi:hypothetical protein RyT2_24940 [Pseudolactococcus yaeyamensis]